MEFQIDLAQHADIAPWVELSEEVADLFGPMPGFTSILTRKINQKQAFCARIAGRKSLLGGMLMGGSGDTFWIRWLAVAHEFRRFGVGRALVERAIAFAPPQSTLQVDTFTEGNAGGAAARRLYENLGFTPGEVWQNEGAIRQRYVRAVEHLKS
ncbi:GNAT family N-acetyltransferase [Agrobacterium rhizogenes]|uniref:GNAT family N-acetyltransferase n=1 Tax=Rhizobium rhizogenes TaxID=359 RepID=UPI001572F760|nr:GNAT family N-acetyltransferase [Rhizobium rhizogenes]NTH12100.1 GNAT family N-acetyltransferase [Rhizobium rhizogenes]